MLGYEELETGRAEQGSLWLRTGISDDEPRAWAQTVNVLGSLGVLRHLHSLECWVMVQSWLFNSSLALCWGFSEWVLSLPSFHISI